MGSAQQAIHRLTDKFRGYDWRPVSISCSEKLKQELQRAADATGIGHVLNHAFRHTYGTWLDLVGTPVGVQQRLMRHADIRTTMKTYGDVVTPDMREASGKVAILALNGW